MGFPVGYAQLLLPKLLIYSLFFFSFLRNLITAFSQFLGLPDFLEPDISAAEFHSAVAVLIRDILPVVKFSDLIDPPDSCAVCLYDFEGEDEIRRLTNCRHVFHRSCLDRWVDCDRKTCPLCRTAVIPDDMQESFNERLRAASGIPEFYDDFSQISEF